MDQKKKPFFDIGAKIAVSPRITTVENLDARKIRVINFSVNLENLSISCYQLKKKIKSYPSGDKKKMDWIKKKLCPSES